VSAGGRGALAGKRIVLTRTPEQADDLVSRLTREGAKIFLLPMVRFTEAADASDLDRAIGELDRFDWLIFTSANAVRFFYRRLRTLQPERKAIPPTLQCAVVGPATQKALEDEGAHAKFGPRQPGATSTALAAEIGRKLAGKRALVPRSNLANDDLPAALRAAGAIVSAVVAYHTEEPESLDSEVLAALQRGDTDAIVFFSPSAFQHFADVMGTKRLVELRGRLAFAAIGPTTAAAIRESDMPVSVEAMEATTDALVASLQRYFTPQTAGKERT
jgi:uroporphyrinogen III methyltransferase/synthase